jgi:transposase
LKHLPETNDTYINQEVFCSFLEKIAASYAESNCPITLILDNAKYQKCQSVYDKAKELGIGLLYLPPYSPNLNLIERVWRFVKKQVLYYKHYDKFVDFKNSIDNCMCELATKFKSNMESLITPALSRCVNFTKTQALILLDSLLFRLRKSVNNTTTPVLLY